MFLGDRDLLASLAKRDALIDYLRSSHREDCNCDLCFPPNGMDLHSFSATDLIDYSERVTS